MSEHQHPKTTPVEPPKQEEEKPENIVISVFKTLLEYNYNKYGVKKDF